MNRINPRKLKSSKWTAVAPRDKQKHFVVTEADFDEDGAVVESILQAVMTRHESSNGIAIPARDEDRESSRGLAQCARPRADSGGALVESVYGGRVF